MFEVRIDVEEIDFLVVGDVLVVVGLGCKWFVGDVVYVVGFVVFCFVWLV